MTCLSFILTQISETFTYKQHFLEQNVYSTEFLIRIHLFSHIERKFVFKLNQSHFQSVFFSSCT